MARKERVLKGLVGLYDPRGRDRRRCTTCAGCPDAAERATGHRSQRIRGTPRRRATDVFRWRRDGDRLHLERVGADTSKPYDIPYQVFDAAYMIGWWVRTDCALQTGQDC